MFIFARFLCSNILHLLVEENQRWYVVKGLGYCNKCSQIIGEMFFEREGEIKKFDND